MPTPFPILLVQTADESTIGSIHHTTGWYVVGILGFIGLWGILLAVFRREPGKSFWIAAGIGIAAAILQASMGLWAFSVDEVQPGNQHLFYGVVMMFTFAFTYIYRSQLSRRPALAYGVLFLFVMGLGIRGISTFGQSFGG